ncbi:pyruvate kinase [Holotrichia oblita]|nr:pyruvate kinase [Holotrichia oblita]
MVKAVRKELNIPLAIMLDTKGPEIRIKTFEKGKINLFEDAEFTLTVKDIAGNENIVSITYTNLYKALKPSDKIMLNDGLITLEVKNILNGDIICKVLNGGELTNRKSLNVPGIALDMPYLSEIDKQDVLFGIKNDVDFIAASFVRSKDDVISLRNFINENGGKDIDIIAKIENRQGVNNVEDIIKVSDGIMVARGDMGVEIPFVELPAIQKNIIKSCYRAGKKVITATQMLETMIVNPTPTRAEISDIANAVFDGTSATMLSGETAIGKYPVESIKTMAAISKEAEKIINYKKRFLALEAKIDTISDAVSHAACSAAHDLNAKAIIVVTQSGRTAKMISRFRPDVPIVAATTSEKVYNKLAINWGILPCMAKMQDNTDELFAHAIECAKKLNVVKKSDLCVIAAGVPVGISGNTNILKIVIID